MPPSPRGAAPQRLPLLRHRLGAPLQYVTRHTRTGGGGLWRHRWGGAAGRLFTFSPWLSTLCSRNATSSLSARGNLHGLKGTSRSAPGLFDSQAGGGRSGFLPDSRTPGNVAVRAHSPACLPSCSWRASALQTAAGAAPSGGPRALHTVRLVGKHRPRKHGLCRWRHPSWL